MDASSVLIMQLFGMCFANQMKDLRESSGCFLESLNRAVALGLAVWLVLAFFIPPFSKSELFEVHLQK